MKTIERILCEAQDQGLLPIESEMKGVRYIVCPEDKKFVILTVRPREKVILPLKAIKEIAGIAEVWG